MVSPLAYVARGWPFLVARGRHRGYRTVLAPDFLAERNLHSVLSESSNGADMEPGRVRSVDLEHAELGPMTISYRTEQLTSADVDARFAASDELATDEHGRPLEILYGIVARDRMSGPLDGDDLRTARCAALRSYRRFLDQEDGFRVDASRAFALRGVTAVPQRTREEPRQRPEIAPMPERRPPRTGLGVVVAATAIAVLLAWLLWPKPSEPTVSIAKVNAHLPFGAVQCNAATTLELTGVIAVDRATTVTYHWDPGRGTITKTTLRFPGKGSQPVTWDMTIPVGSAQKGGVALVVDAPRALRRTIRYDLGCGATAAAPAATGARG